MSTGAGRNFPDFLNAYHEYAIDGFCPDKFHFWAGVSAVAGALERKVWIPFEGDRFIYPNLYIFLLSSPGIGKSSAGNKAVHGMLDELSSEEGKLIFLPNQMTEAALVSAIAKWKHFPYREKQLTQSAAYFYASEASNSMKEITGGGDIFAMLTDLYDCPKVWVKRTQKDGEIMLNNLCLNILAGCTFSYLKRLFPDENVAGGFASRILYVVHDEKMIRRPKWPLAPDEVSVIKGKLQEDLTRIHKLVGTFRATSDYQKAYEDWFPKHDAHVQSLSSERMQAFLARKHTNILKLSMICSVSESDTLTLELRHWERALKLVEELEKKLPKILERSQQTSTQDGAITRVILQTLKHHGGKLTPNELRKHLIFNNQDIRKAASTIEAMSDSGILRVTLVGNQAYYELLTDSEKYLS